MFVLSEFFASSGFVRSRFYHISSWMQGRAQRVHLPLHPAGNMICSAVTKPEAEDLESAEHERRKEKSL
jgi:ATP-dependent Clp protease adapter protein ClpS